MKVKKIAGVTLSIVAGLFILLLCVFLFWLGPTVKLVAETVGTKALGTPLTIDKLTINPRKGIIHLSEFAIANPDTFGRSNAVSLASLDISIDMGSIFTRTVVVHEVSINSPYFIYEQSTATDNIQEFILSIQEFVGYDPAVPPPPPDPKQLEKERKKKEKKSRKKKETGPRIVVVEWLELNDVQFHLANTGDQLLDFDMGFEKLSLSMTNGTVQLDNFYISNPGRLETPNLFELKRFEIISEPGSIYSTNINIHAVNILKPHAFVEQNPETDTFAEFLEIACGLAAKIPANAPEARSTNVANLAETEPEEPPPPPPEISLGSLTMDDLQLHVVNIGDPKLDVHLGLEQLKAALDTGDITLNNLFLTNPKRLEIPNVFSLDHIEVKVAPESLKSQPLVVEDVLVNKPHAFLELNKDANTVGEFMKIANGFMERLPDYPIPEVPVSARPEAESGEERTSTSEDENTVPPFELHNLLVDDIQIKLLDTTPTNNIPEEPHKIAGIDEISIKLVDGKLQIKGITVPNVAGFTATNIFHLANIDIVIQPDSLFSDQVVIETAFINSPEVNLEQTEESGNVAQLQAALMHFAPPASAQSVTTKQPVAGAEELEMASEPVPLSEQPVVLHQLLITNLAVNLRMPVTTNTQTSGAMHTMDKLSMDKLNPLSNGKKDAPEATPDAPLPLVGFDQLSLKPLEGVVHITGMRVSNPPGFSRKDLVNIEEFRVQLDPDTLQADTLLIKDILIAGPRVRYERQIMGDNIKALQTEIEQATTRRDEYMADEKPEESVEATEPAAEENGQKVIIEHLLISSGMVEAKLSALPSIPVPLPDIELADIGKAEGGASVADASTKIFNVFYDSLIGAVGNATGFAGDALKGVGAFGMGALGNVTDSVTGGIGKAANKTEEAIESMNKKRKSGRGAGGRRRILR